VINLHGVPLNVYTIFLPSSGTGYYRRRQSTARASLLCMPSRQSRATKPKRKRKNLNYKCTKNSFSFIFSYLHTLCTYVMCINTMCFFESYYTLCNNIILFLVWGVEWLKVKCVYRTSNINYFYYCNYWYLIILTTFNKSIRYIYHIRDTIFNVYLRQMKDIYAIYNIYI